MPPIKRFGYKLVVPVSDRVNERLDQLAHGGNKAELVREILDRTLFPGETKEVLPVANVQDLQTQLTKET
jgi:hypothetical protein